MSVMSVLKYHYQKHAPNGYLRDVRANKSSKPNSLFQGWLIQSFNTWFCDVVLHR